MLLLSKNKHNILLTNTTVGLLGRHFNMLLLMILQFLSGFGSKLQEVRLLFPLLISNFFFTQKKKKEREKRNSNARSA
jgi:hypothetical protein